MTRPGRCGTQTRLHARPFDTSALESYNPTMSKRCLATLTQAGELGSVPDWSALALTP